MFEILSCNDVKIERNRFGSVNSAEIEGVGSAHPDLIRGHKSFVCHFYRSTLADSSTNLEIWRAENLCCRKETHLQFIVFVNFEEFFETFFENWISERVCHDVEPACHVKATFHFDDTDLIKGTNEQIKDDARFLRSFSALLIKLGSCLHMFRIVVLYVNMTSNLLFEVFVDDFSRTYSHSASNQIHHARASIKPARHFKN